MSKNAKNAKKVTEVRENSIVFRGKEMPVAPGTPQHIKEHILKWHQDRAKGLKAATARKKAKQGRKNFGNISSAFDGIQV
jgi:hypothetical protein